MMRKYTLAYGLLVVALWLIPVVSWAERDYIFGFESGSLFGEPVIDNMSPNRSGGIGNLFIEQAIVRSGNFSLKIAPTSTTFSYWDMQGSKSLTNKYIRFYIRITQLPRVTRGLFSHGVIQSTVSPVLYLTSSGRLIFDGNGAALSQIALTDPEHWYRIELKLIDGAQELQIDGATQVRLSGSVTAFGVRFGPSDIFESADISAGDYVAYIDDVAIDSAQYPGESSVGLLLPASDGERSTLWTAGLGGISNLWNAIINVPPLGTANETNTTQIEHAGSAPGTDDHYDINMDTYSDIGIDSNDTIHAVQPYLIHGEDSKTGSKLLAFQGISNPLTENSGSFLAGLNIGALGIFPYNWFAYSLRPTNTPIVTLDTPPVIRILRPEIVSRIASVCFVGMYVEYTPIP